MLTEDIKKNMIYKTFPAKKEEWENVSLYVENELLKHNIDKKNIMEILITFEELYVNISSYAYKNLPSGEGDMTLGLGIINDNVYMQFIDEGVPFDPTEKSDPDLTLSAEDREIGGLGIYMAKTWADEFSYKREKNKNILTFIKNYKKDR